MNPNLRLTQLANIAPMLAPVDVNGGAVATDYISAVHSHRIGIIVAVGAMAADSALTLQLTQATAAAGTGAKQLVLVAGDVYEAGSDNPVAADSLIDGNGKLALTKANAENKVVIIDLPANRLDVSNSFTHVSLTGSDPTKSIIVGIVAVFHPPAYSSDNDGVPDVTD